MREWHYEPAEDLDRGLVERLRRFPREPDMLVYGVRSLAALLLRGWLRLYHRLEIRGREHLPADGSLVLVANHASHLDTLCLLAALPLRKLHRAFPVAARDYFFVSMPRVAVAAVVVNALPFERQAQFRQSLALCRALLGNPGNVLILFPEGTRSVDGTLQPFRPGIGLLVAGTDLPVLPCYVRGTFAAWPKGAWWPRPRKLHLTIGPARRFAGRTPDRDGAQRVAMELEEAVRQLEQHP